MTKAIAGESSAKLERCSEIIKKSIKARLQRSVLASSLTTFCIGGRLALLVEPESLGDLASLVKILNGEGIGYRVVGAGSNLLVADNGIADEVVIRLGQGFRTLDELDAATFRVGSAYSLMTLSRSLSDSGLSGLEFAGGIPASIGGAARMNAGAHGGQFAELIEGLTFVDGSGQVVNWRQDELKFSYRHTNIPKDAIVTAVDIRLATSDRAATTKRRADCLAERKLRQPLSAPSAGSVFRNPSPDRTAGMLIDQAGLKGRSVGGAKISPVHANWIVNEGRTASFADVIALIELAQHEVLRQFGVELQPELVRWT